jgi:molybdopterin-binding protein
MKLSAQNKLLGTVTSISTGSVNSVVKLQLNSAPVVTAVITNEAVEELGLAEGGEATAVIKASNVMIGICQDGKGCGCQT